MIYYTKDEFVAHYGDFGFPLYFAGNVKYVWVEDNVASCYNDVKKIASISFIYHDIKYVKHGISQQIIDEHTTYFHYVYDKKHHEHEAAQWGIWNSTGHITEEKWYINGCHHRDDGPAIIAYYEDGSLRVMEWWHDGMMHRDDGPGYISYYEDGQLEYEVYYYNAKLHRIGGPAWCAWDENGVLIEEKWFIDNDEIEPVIESSTDEIETPEDDVLELPDHWEDAEPEFD